MKYLLALVALCACSITIASTAATAQVCEGKESGAYVVFQPENVNAKAKCVIGGTRCETLFTAKDSKGAVHHFALVPSVSLAGSPLKWKAELQAPADQQIVLAGGFELTSTKDKVTLKITAREIVPIDANRYRVAITNDLFVASLTKGGSVDWTYTDQTNKPIKTPLKFAMSGSEKALNFVKCIQGRSSYRTACESSNVKSDWVMRHRTINDANDVLGALNQQVEEYSFEDFGHDEGRFSEDDKKRLKQQAVDLFKRARTSYDNFFRKVAAKTTRACEVCDLKPLFVIAKKGGIGAEIKESELIKVVERDKLGDLEVLANTNGNLEITRKKFENMAFTHPEYASTQVRLKNLEEETKNLTTSLWAAIRDPGAEEGPFEPVVAKYACDEK